SQDYSEEIAAKIDSEIHSIISEAYLRAKTILTENIDKLHFIAEFLLRNEIMDGEQFKAAMDGTPTFEELEEMTEAKKRKSREENDERRRRLEKEAQEKENAEAESDSSNEDTDENSDENSIADPSEDTSSDSDDKDDSFREGSNNSKF
ncbi:MAG: hypothetical protein J6Q77_02285, partial [Clostridia bacterium]|nr:hypothetical protein [Clostridia bacterium]